MKPVMQKDLQTTNSDSINGEKLKSHTLYVKKKIPETLIDEALYNINEEQYRDTLLQILENKQKNTKAADKYDLHAKLFRFAASKGFEPDIIQSVIQSMKL